MSLEYGSTTKGLGCTTIKTLLIEEGLLFQARQHTSVIPALRRLRQKDLDFQASLGYTASFRLAWAT